MSVRLLCCSHSPLMEIEHLGDERERRMQAAFARAATLVAAYDPELIVCFAPDHFNGFFYDVMPPFCIGMEATSVGDYRSLAGSLRVASGHAERLVQAAFAGGVDVAVSYDMRVDHGFAQSLVLLTGSLDRYPVVPVFVNAAAPPLSPLARSVALGRALGKALTGAQRVLVLGSGGLSHDPPVPQLDGATGDIRDLLLRGRNPTPERRAIREGRVIEAAHAMLRGDSTRRSLNPAWDRAVLDMLRDYKLDPPAIDEARITADAGVGGHEIRSWVAAFSALAAAHGPYVTEELAYETVPEWIAAMSIVWAEPIEKGS